MDYLGIAIKAAKEAGKILIQKYPLIDYNLKQDNSPVTEADRIAENKIKTIIKKYCPNHGFICEESGNENNNSEYKWIIDPLDGTKNYLRKIPFFSTLIALSKNDEIILGVSYAPLLKELIYAEKGKGAYLNGKKINVSKIDLLEKSYLSFGGINLFEKKGNLKQLLSLAGKTMGRRGFGDAYSYHLLASGKIDIMVEPKTNIWDFAPFCIIIKEAGGKITDIKGKSISLKSDSVISTNGLLQDKVVKEFNN
ncbi:MAG: inositol monophosphatase [Candidatus Nanoarchaeia archaeon]|nr:inositol monophosphatase [Candidatus Nanoarchaeia archaeon]